MTSPRPPAQPSDDEWTEERLREVESYIARIDNRSEPLAARAMNPDDPQRENAKFFFEWDARQRDRWVEERGELLKRLGRG